MITNVLIVEDEALIAEDLRDQVERLGHRVTGVLANIADALACVRREPPDVVLMDIRLQGEGDGIDAAIEIAAGDGVPVIFLTAHSDAGTLERALLTRPAAYLVKPVRPTELESAIRAACERRAAERRAAVVERHLRRLLEHSGDIVLRLSQAGRLMYVNPAGRRALGLEAVPLTRLLADLAHPDDHESLAWAHARADRGDPVVPVRFRLRSVGGEAQCVEGVLSGRNSDSADTSVWGILCPVNGGVAADPSVSESTGEGGEPLFGAAEGDQRSA
jgi:PAS domain S-box-containing protein